MTSPKFIRCPHCAFVVPLDVKQISKATHVNHDGIVCITKQCHCSNCGRKWWQSWQK